MACRAAWMAPGSACRRTAPGSARRLDVNDHIDPEKVARTAFADGARLLADIGATHARFALQTAPGAYRSVRVLTGDHFDGIAALLRFYLAEHPEVRLNHAALALANPVDGDYVRMTNRPWAFSTDA